jgi:hypothetical protein
LLTRICGDRIFKAPDSPLGRYSLGDFDHFGFGSPQLAARAIPKPLRVRHSRMLLSGIQARPKAINPEIIALLQHPAKIRLSDSGHTARMLAISGFIFYPFAFIP